LITLSNACYPRFDCEVPRSARNDKKLGREDGEGVKL